METKNIAYEFIFSGGQHKQFNLRFKKDTMLFIPDACSYPSWTLLANNQCSNCTLNSKTTPYCPVSVNLIPLLEWCTDLVSHEKVKIKITTKERIIIVESTVQRAISSLLGLIMASSQCPHTLFLRPMAHFHLPLATQEETLYRATSMYLLARFTSSHYVKSKADFALEKLKDLYKNLQSVNSGLSERLREVSSEDSAANAVILLDLYAKGINYSVDDTLDDLKYIFNEYLNEDILVDS